MIVRVEGLLHKCRRGKEDSGGSSASAHFTRYLFLVARAWLQNLSLFLPSCSLSRIVLSTYAQESQTTLATFFLPNFLGQRSVSYTYIL